MNWNALTLVAIGGVALIIGVRGNGSKVWTAVTGLAAKPPNEVLFPVNIGGSSSADFGTPNTGTSNTGKITTTNPPANANQFTRNNPTPSSIINAVTPVAQAQGVPTALWENIASQESNFNPNAVGDSGTSWGIFQLHRGGQADAAFAQGKTINDLFNPAINAQYAMPAIGAAWRQLSSSFDDSLHWWEVFSGASGHPGGSAGNQITDQYASKIKAQYDTGLFGRI